MNKPCREKTLWQCIKRFFYTHTSKHPSVIAEEVHERSKEFNKDLLEKRVQHDAKSGKSMHGSIPDRWHTTTLIELQTYVTQSRTTDTADTLSDKAWGLLEEVSVVFSTDGKKMTSEDMSMLENLVALAPDTTKEKITLAELFACKEKKVAAQEHIRISTLKMRGHA